MKLLNQKFIVKFNIWSNPEKTFFIYKVEPIGNTEMQRHPIYKGYSVLTETNLPLFSEVEADLSVNTKKGAPEYTIVKIHHKFPKDPISQWNYLEKLANNQNFKTIYKKLKDNYNENEKILDILTDESNTEKIVNLFDSEQNKEKIINIIQSLSQNKANSIFNDSLPPEVAEILTESQVSRLVNINPNNPEEVAKQFLDNPFYGIQAEGLGFKTLDSIREKLAELYPYKINYKLDTPDRIYYGSYSILSDEILSKGNTFVDIFNFKTMLEVQLGLPLERLDMFFEEELETTIAFPDFKLVVKDDIITTKDLFDSEMFIYDYLSDRIYSEYSEFELSRIEPFLKEECLELTDEQISVFHSAIKNPVSLVLGPGGVGKTFTISKVIKFLEEELHKSVFLAAPTGKAAQVLSNYARKEAYTLHSLFKINPGHTFENYNSIFEKKIDYLIIDEFSMVDSALFAKALKAISNKKTKVIIIGDEFQLPSVAPGNLLHIFNKYDLVNSIKLTKNFRVSQENSGIIRLSEEFRKGYFSQSNQDDKMYALAKDCILQNIPMQDLLYSRTLAVYNKFLKEGVDPKDILVLTPTNKGLLGQAHLNTRIQELIRLNRNASEYEFYLEQTIYSIKTRFYKGDIVLFQNNIELTEDNQYDFLENRQIKVNNGDLGEIVDIDDFYIKVKLLNTDKIVRFESGMISIISLGYCYTIHKSQGSESRYGILVVGSSAAFQLNSNLLYTGITRFKEKCYILGDFKSIRWKVQTFINKDRDTILEKTIFKHDIVF